jgi:Sec-independent protein translocase protein TatA
MTMAFFGFTIGFGEVLLILLVALLLCGATVAAIVARMTRRKRDD